MNQIESTTSYEKDGFVVSTDRARLNIPAIHAFLTDSSYWARNISLQIVEKSIEHSFCFGLYNDKSELIGFARVVSDYSTFAWLADVFVVESYRGRGLGTWLLKCIVAHPELQGLRRWLLATRSAHEVYQVFGFKPLLKVHTFMEIYKPDIYEEIL